MLPIARPTLLFAAVALTASSAAAQRPYVAPSDRTVVSSTEEQQMDPPMHLIYVENRSTVPITVFGVSLSGCENVKSWQCSPHRVRINVRPGQRQLVTRVGPDNSSLGFSYHFGFSWNADSGGIAAVAALAAAGDTTSRALLARRSHADSVERTASGPHANELSRDDFAALGTRAVALRAFPDSLVLTPGERTSMERIRLFLVDAQGTILGRTQWAGWQAPYGRTVEVVPSDMTLIARSPGRAVFRYHLADEAQQLLRHTVEELEVPIVVAYRADPHAPTFAGTALDADAHAPLACARVALEDSAQNVVTATRTDRTGAFSLAAPRPGTYRVGVETAGWATVYAPDELAGPDERKRHDYPVRFTEQLLVGHRPPGVDEFQHAYPAAVTTLPFGAPGRGAAAPIVRGVTFGGSESAPVLGIVGRVPAGRAWMQFVVDSAGHVDPASVLLPTGTSPTAIASVRTVLPRVRFSPARDAGHPTCEFVRMEVAFRVE